MSDLATRTTSPPRDEFKFSYILWAFLFVLYVDVLNGISFAYELYLEGDLLWLGPTLIAPFVWLFFIVSNAIKLRWRRMLSVVVAPFLGAMPVIAFAYFGATPDRVRFEYHKSDFLKDVEDSAAAHGHPVLINWGWGEIAGGFGGASTEFDLIYDETDQIASPPASWSAEFRNRLMNGQPRKPGENYGEGGRLFPSDDNVSEPVIDSMGGHFYLVSQLFE
ncbi:hypothetical protein PY650_24385 [Rhizobium calliandrae]|uniref:Uncharacterized protein n=1 Tax=Rhizobium calliandrae TaxID=1312182 RepID=A0ABT7KL81_9HYPH|nr:hypothetical protein [Rhizobium calliandrae]MDL2408723.1 hypothetical protein [Rhizobium calliandrae]